MKTSRARARLLFVSLALLAAANAFAAGVASERVLVIGQAGWRDQPRELAGYAGDEIVFDILIPKSLDRSALQIQPIQISGGVAVPLGGPRPITDFAGGRSPDSYGLIELRVGLPELQRKTFLALVVSTSAEPTTKVSVVHVVVYPHFDWAPIKRKLTNDRRRLVLFGKNQTLSDFLQTKKIDVSNELEGVPEAAENDTIYLGTSITSGRGAHAFLTGQSTGQGTARVVVFTENKEEEASLLSDRPPGVYVHKANKTTVTEVTLRLVDCLGSDPRCEEILFNLIEKQLRATPVATP